MTQSSNHFFTVFTILIMSYSLTACMSTEEGIHSTQENTGVIVASAPESPTDTTPAADYGTAALSWLPPTQNTDGSNLDNLAGYRIYYGTNASNLNNVVTINYVGVANYLIENLPVGYTYYFAITAFDSNGRESAFSEIGSKNITS